jgi:hypothetical protein
MLGIESPMVGCNVAQRPLIHSPSPPTVKKRKKSSYPFRSLLSTTAPCGCHSIRPVLNTDAILPCCCHAPLARPCCNRFSPPPFPRAGPSGARSAHRACRPPGRAKLAASGDGARAPPLPVGSDPGGWNRPAPAFIFSVFHMYVLIVSDVLDVCCNFSILMLQK